MSKYKYEKFKAKAGSKEYILSQHDGDNWEGPAIEHLCKDNTTNIGFMIGQKRYSFEINLLNTKGDEYVIKENNKDGYPNGPIIIVSNNTLYLGPYYSKKGFHGIVYKIKKGERIHIQEYKHGILMDECLSDQIIYEDVAQKLPFDAWYEIEPNEFIERKINNKDFKGTEYIAGDPTGHQHILAVRESDENIVIGQFMRNTINGLAMEYDSKLKIATLQFYDKGEALNNFRLLYSREVGYTLLYKDTQIKDGKVEYINLNYIKNEGKPELQIRYLDKNIDEIGESKILPNYIDPTAEKPYGTEKAKHLPKKDENGLTARERLNNLIGLDKVKNEISLLEAIAKKNPDNPITLNMCFYGNPGTGKTEVAKLLAEVLYDEGLLKENKLIETDPSGLVAEYVGQTQIKTHEKVQEALNGVLFIDEAYTLASGGYKGTKGDFGAEAIAALLQDMETYRGQICVILAGYRKPMEEMIASNPGFASRINRKIDFSDYNLEELEQIASLIVNKNKYSADNEVIKAIAKIVDSRRFLDSFANARDVRVVIEKLTEIQAQRTINEKSNRTITMEDVNKYGERDLPVKEDGKTAEERLKELIGLDNVKLEIERMVAILEKNKGDLGKTNLHMCFYGNPGTGKTEVARLIADILYDKGILPTNKCEITNKSGLVGMYRGETAIKTHKLVKSALNGVLFIDEAYSLNSSGDNAQEAVAALIEDMENYRGKFCVILAGYKNEMEELLQVNPGFDSRINRKIDFPDYTTNELLQIAQLLINKKGYIIEDDAKTELGKLLLAIKEKANKEHKAFANAREVRNILESVYEIQALRTNNNKDDFKIILSDIKEYEDNHNIDTNEKEQKKKNNIKVDVNIIKMFSSGEYFHVDVDFIKRASVNIKVETSEGKGEGSGFLISSDGIIGTCAHVVKDAEKITVIINYVIGNDDYITKDYAAEVIAINEYDDTAIIGIINNNVKQCFYQLTNEKVGYPKLMSKLVMGGYPFGGSRFENISINEGTVQSINQDSFDESENYWIYVDMLGQPGSSGSGVISAESGQIVGIFAGCSINPKNKAQTINRIIPVKYLWDLLNNLNENKTENIKYLGDMSYNEAPRYFDEERYNNKPIIDEYFYDNPNVYDNIKIVRGDVTTYTGDAIVNAANKYLAPGAGVCGAVYKAAGYKELDQACKLKGAQEVGSATLTSGFNLQANYIIHAVGPRFDVDKNPEKLLAKVYENCFKVARENKITSIAFPSISTGIYHFPIDIACPIALREMIRNSESMKEIVIYCFDELTYRTYIDNLNRLKGK